jgi:hypothetical protein
MAHQPFDPSEALDKFDAWLARDDRGDEPPLSPPAPLDPDLEASLRAHLTPVLTPAQLGSAIWALRLWLPVSEHEALHRAALRSEREAERAHFATMASQVETLQALLRRQRPLIATSGIEWAALDQALALLADSARQHSLTHQPPNRPGAPAHEWRDSLIALVWSFYPPAARTEGGRLSPHLIDTVRQLLDALDRPVENLPEVMRAALKRCPDPPFTIGPRG